MRAKSVVQPSLRFHKTSTLRG